MEALDKIIAALKLAEAARKYADAVCQRKQAQSALDHAYRRWKRDNGIGYVERDSMAWKAMMNRTAADYGELVKAKRKERYHRDRLVTLVGRVSA